MEMTMNPLSADVMRPDAAANYLALSVQRLARMRLEGSGPTFIKLGRTVLYRRNDLEAWLNSRRRRSTSEQNAA